MEKLRWIQLSDIHFSGNEGYEIKRMRDSLIDQIKKITDDKVINFVVVSGDLVYQNASYDSQLKNFLEAILEERKTYEKNRRRRPKEFRDWNYICCSTYGNPRSKGFHQKYYKDLLKSLDLPDIHFHQLRNTYATILLKNSFNSKGVSHLLGHAKEIISVDVDGDTQEIIEDCLDVLEPFIEEVIPKEREDQYYDYSEVIEIDLILKEYFNAA